MPHIEHRIRRNEMARLLGVTTRTLDRWCAAGVMGVRLHRHRIGGTTGFTWGDVEAFRRAVEARRAPLPARTRR